MTGTDLLLGAGVPAGFAAAALLVRPAVRASRLGIAHPAVVWLALEGVFFGVGSVSLALVDGQPGPALYVAAAAASAGLGTYLARRLVLARGSVQAEPDAPPRAPAPESGLRRLVPAILAVASLAVLAPTIVGTGLALISADPTAARSELVGIPIQLIRVALPGLAAILLLELLAGRPVLGRPVANWVLLGVLLALSVLLASRYLAAELLATMALAWLLAGRRFALRLVIAAGLIVAAGFVAIGVARAPNDFANSPVVTAAERTASRLFLVQPRTIAALQATIPSEQPYFLGLTWARRLGPLFGRTDIPNLGYWIYPRVVAEVQATAGYAAPGLVGEAWANFGPAGLSLFVLLGMGLERLGALVATRRTRVVDIAAGALAIVFVARTHALGLLGVALLLGLVGAWRLLLATPAAPSGRLTRILHPVPRRE